jgi:hypothetical protein
VCGYEKSLSPTTSRDNFFQYSKKSQVSPYKTKKIPQSDLGVSAAFGDFYKLGSEKTAKINGIS